jgi:hypothetical protein
MVGLSMIVALAVHSESLAQSWNFPKDFFEAFVYASSPIPYQQADQIRKIPGVAQSCIINDSIECKIFSGREWFFYSRSRFIAGDPDDFFKVAKLEFVEGNKEQAIAKLKKGGYVLVTPEFTRVKKVSYGETVTITELGSPRGHRSNFEIAGVVTSPALDVAANYFNAGGLLANQSVLIAMGTMEDARRIFKIPNMISMFLINFDLPIPDNLPEEFNSNSPPVLSDPATFVAMLNRWRIMMPERSAEIDQINRRLEVRSHAGGKLWWHQIPLSELFRDSLDEKVIPAWSDLTPVRRWQTFREELVMRLLAWRCGSTVLAYASVRDLKDRIDRDLRRATALITMVPVVALLVAALGAANLMMANVASRSQQIAILRAIGTTKSQVTRLILGEALVLGVVGCLMGVALGMQAAYGMKTMTTMIWGLKSQWFIPWGWVMQGIIFTMLVCLLAGVLPARRAARNNIIDAMQAT